jgi:hypothetical protein
MELGAPHMCSSWLRKRSGTACPTAPVALLSKPLTSAQAVASRDVEAAVLTRTMAAAAGLSSANDFALAFGGGGLTFFGGGRAASPVRGRDALPVVLM